MKRLFDWPAFVTLGDEDDGHNGCDSGAGHQEQSCKSGGGGDTSPNSCSGGGGNGNSCSGGGGDPQND